MGVSGTGGRGELLGFAAMLVVEQDQADCDGANAEEREAHKLLLVGESDSIDADHALLGDVEVRASSEGQQESGGLRGVHRAVSDTRMWPPV